jgi:hypothetical protein
MNMEITRVTHISGGGGNMFIEYEAVRSAVLGTGGAKMTGAELIAAERKRQLKNKGYTLKHDEGHTKQELLVVAAALILRALNEVDSASITVDEFLGYYAPLEDMAWMHYIVEHERPDKIEGLAIAGALIAAEIDRLQMDEKGEGRAE